LNLFDATIIRKANKIVKNEDFFEKSIVLKKSKTSANLVAVLKPGLKVLFYLENRQELEELSNEHLSSRLYYVKVLFDSKTGTIQFQHHLESRTDKQLSEKFKKEEYGQMGKNGFSKFDLVNTRPRLLLSPINFNFIIEGHDFIIEQNGKVIIKR
jgi:CRISPR-associated endonuclease Csn1